MTPTPARRLIIALMLAFLWPTAQVDAATPPMRRGINLAAWLANAPRQPLYERDFYHLAEAGFDHIRLPFNPEQFGFILAPAAGQEMKTDLAPLERALDLAMKHRLAVTIDLHPLSKFMKTVEDNDWAEERVIRLWVHMAHALRRYPADKVAFGLLNEPQYYRDHARYRNFITRLAAAVRSEAPDHTLVVAAPEGSSLDGLQKFTPLEDANIVYDFHFYEPYMVTHQGAHTGFPTKMLRYFRHVPYPAARVDRDAAFYAPTASNPAQAQTELQEYIDAGWSRERISARIALAVEWAKQHRARIVCGEFGVLRTFIDKASRYRWIADTRRTLEANGIGWELWDYADLAGIAAPVGATSTDPTDHSVRLIHPEQGYRRIEPEALQALGLRH